MPLKSITNSVNICIDATPLDTGHKFRGIGRYVQGLLYGMAEIHSCLNLRTLRIARGYRSDPVCGFEPLLIHRPVWPRRFQWMLNNLLLPGIIARSGVALYHATDNRSIPVHSRYRTVATLYDAIPLKIPEIYRVQNPWDEQKCFDILLKHIQKIPHAITISNSTKADLIRLAGIVPDRITVTYLAHNPLVFRPCVETRVVLAKYNLPQKYFLYVGARDTRKNIGGILEGYRRIRPHVQERFVIVGNWEHADRVVLQETLSKLGLEDAVMLLGYVSDEVLACIYSFATALIFISRYEGFGLPLLEAMACGCPVLASNNSSVPEVVGAAGLLMDPQDLDRLASCMGDLSANSILRESLRQKGLTQAAKFSWRRCAQETLAVYAKVLSD